MEKLFSITHYTKYLFIYLFIYLFVCLFIYFSVPGPTVPEYSQSSLCVHSRKRPASRYDQHCETPFDLSLKLCNQKLS